MINVLIVDDDHLVRKGFIAMMPWEIYGLRVVGEAGNGKKALEFMERHQVDLLITDLAMPVMSGLELMKEVKHRYPETDMVVLTFHQDFELIQEALRLGALDYITKIELEQEQLDEVLRRVVERIHQWKALTESHASSRQREKDDDHLDRHISMQELHEIGECWAKPDWMMDERVFRGLIDETDRLKLTAAQLERLFYVAADHWKRLFGSEFLPEAFPGRQYADWNDWAAWLEEVRAAAETYNRSKDYSAEVKASIWKAVDFIQRELQENLHLLDVAKRVNMSRSYFSRCFRDIVGQTFNDYVRDIRVEHAKALLRQTGKTIGWIAAQSGYPNEKYFCRVFRDVTGMLPSEFRKKENESKRQV
ncbi:response regulator transcription factor [Paenibacillus sedimenti]|uniref:Response regulator n=1 Tax=Paenibacillus sedimenti TaxID=2770274 RepID=A0A926KM44_9BACL|nr:response regulator [Paenibacillus sedimenti]MBD0378788.1 response regulator [Paenibacillus sedimenti]